MKKKLTIKEIVNIYHIWKTKCRGLTVEEMNRLAFEEYVKWTLENEKEGESKYGD